MGAKKKGVTAPVMLRFCLWVTLAHVGLYLLILMFVADLEGK